MSKSKAVQHEARAIGSTQMLAVMCEDQDRNEGGEKNSNCLTCQNGMKDRNTTKTHGITSSTESRDDQELQDNITVQLEMQQTGSVKYNIQSLRNKSTNSH